MLFDNLNSGHPLLGHFPIVHCFQFDCLICCSNYLTMTWGAAARTTTVATTVNILKVIKHILSSTMAANFQSFSIFAASSSLRILSLITRISFRILTSSRCMPEWAKLLKIRQCLENKLCLHEYIFCTKLLMCMQYAPSNGFTTRSRKYGLMG